MTAITERARLEQYLEISAPLEKEHLDIVEAEQLNGYPLLHISSDTEIKEFKPFVTRRYLDGGNEDRTIPRISVSTQLFRAAMGRGGTVSDFEIGYNNKNWKGGYHVYGFRPEVCVRPKKELLADVDGSDEHWLLRYSPTTQVYYPEKLGKVFITDMQSTQDALKKRTVVTKVTWYVEVYNGCDFIWYGNTVLKAGYHRITESYTMREGKRTLIFTYEVIGKEIYDNAKEITASVLSMTQYPPSNSW